VTAFAAVTTDLETLRNEAPTWAPTSAVASVFRHAFGQAALDRLTCCADITPAIVTEWGEPLALGRTARYANATLMQALWLRDGGCVSPGCDNKRVHAHHIVEWQHGGDTNLANMALVCSRDHTLLSTNTPGDSNPTPTDQASSTGGHPTAGHPTPPPTPSTATPAPPHPSGDALPPSARLATPRGTAVRLLGESAHPGRDVYPPPVPPRAGPRRIQTG